MERINIRYFDSPFEELILGSHRGGLCRCEWLIRNRSARIDSRMKSGREADYRENDDNVTRETHRQLAEYFSNGRKVFDIPLLMVGSPLQKQVLHGLLKIPFGKTIVSWRPEAWQ